MSSWHIVGAQWVHVEEGKHSRDSLSRAPRCASQGRGRERVSTYCVLHTHLISFSAPGQVGVTYREGSAINLRSPCHQQGRPDSNSRHQESDTSKAVILPPEQA